VLAYDLIGSSLVALGALSIATMRVRANWGLTALDRTLGAETAASVRAPIQDSDRQHHQRSKPSVVELGVRIRRRPRRFHSRMSAISEILFGS